MLKPNKTTHHAFIHILNQPQTLLDRTISQRSKFNAVDYSHYLHRKLFNNLSHVFSDFVALIRDTIKVLQDKHICLCCGIKVDGRNINKAAPHPRQTLYPDSARNLNRLNTIITFHKFYHSKLGHILNLN